MKIGLTGRRRSLIVIVSALVAMTLLYPSARAQPAITDGVAWGPTIEDLRLGVAIENPSDAPQQLRILFQNRGKSSFTIFLGIVGLGLPYYHFKVWAISPAGKEVECFIFSTGSGFGRLVRYSGMGNPISAQIPPGRTYEVKLTTEEVVKAERLSDVHLSQMLEQGYKAKVSYYMPARGYNPNVPDQWAGGKIVSGEIGLPSRHR